MTQQHALVTFPATEDLEDFEKGTAHSADITVRWAALHRDNQNNRTLIFTEDDAGPIALQAALTIVNHHPQADPPLSNPAHWSPHQRRKLVSIALDSWHYGTGLPLYPALILESYSKGELDFIRSPNQPEPGEPHKVQAIINATPSQLSIIRSFMGLDPKPCHTADNGVTLYEEDGPTILSALSKHRSTKNNHTPEWQDLSRIARIGLLNLAAESPSWPTEGKLDHYRVEEFLDEYPGVLEPPDAPQG